MAQPTDYNKLTDYTTYQTNNPGEPMSGASLDAEFSAIETTVDEILTNLALIQRDDTEIANNTVGIDQLKTELSFGLNAVTDWATATDYALRAGVWQGNALYYCTEAHTSGTFATDLAASKWSLILDLDSYITAAQAAQTAAETAQGAAETAQTGAEEAQTAAELAEAGAITVYDNFDDRYLGAKTSDPALDNDGDALITGALYWNSTAGELRVYNGASWNTIPTLNNKDDATAAPTVSNDETENYGVGSWWVDVTNDEMYVCLDASTGAAVWEKITTDADDFVVGVNRFRNNLTSLIHANLSRGWQDLYKAGWVPMFHQQQWGGAAYGGLPDGSNGEAATGYIVSDGSTGNVASSSSTVYVSQGFEVSQNTELSSIWVKIGKVGNPTNNLELYIYDDSAGTPNAVITNGTATAQSGKLHTDDSDGEWVRFTFSTNPSLSANTQYHIALKSSGASDISNHWVWAKDDTFTLYPHGGAATADSTPTWSTATGRNYVFIVEPATSILQSTGLFGDGKIVTYEGSPLNQSGATRCKNSYMDINHQYGTFFLSTESVTASKTLLDTGVGIDHDRIRFSIDASGYAQVELWESDETKHTVTGTTDVRAVDSVIGFTYRAKGDGSDYLKLFVQGVSEGTPVTAETIVLDKGFADYGTTILGGGFPTAPTWTDNEDMSVLPSASGWTFTGAATEADVFVVDGGVLYQNGAGYASTDNGYYSKTTTLNNATGGVVSTAFRIKEGRAINLGEQSVRLVAQDGTKRVDLRFTQYYMSLYDGSGYTHVQHDFTKLTRLVVSWKGSDVYVFIDGALALDGTGLLINATGTNSIQFGDDDTTGGENATAEWHYVKYYEGAFLPEVNAAQISEAGYWADDKSSLLSTIYNSGTIQSAKELAGLDRDYVREVERSIYKQGIVSSPTTTATSFDPLDDMGAFAFCENVSGMLQSDISNNGGGNTVYLSIAVDGKEEEGVSRGARTDTATGRYFNVTHAPILSVYAGLHYIQGGYYGSAGTTTAQKNDRLLSLEAK